MAAAVPKPSFQSKASNYDEASMHQTLLFSDSLKDLRNMRTQLYSAAEYFELSFANDDQKHMVIETLKDYAVKALVNTVDHLGSVSNKVNNILDQKIGEACGLDLQISCIEQRLRTSNMYMNHEGLSQQSSKDSAPKYHKRYDLPAGEKLNCATHTTSKCNKSSMIEGDRHQLKIDLGMRPDDSTLTLAAVVRNHQYPSRRHIYNKPVIVDKRRTSSPRRLSLSRSGSLASRQTSPDSMRSITPRTSVDGRQSQPEAWKSASMRFYADEKSGHKDFQPRRSKGRRLLEALLSRGKPRKDDMFYTFLDEY